MAQCALVHSNIGKQCNIHENNNNPHGKIQRKILSDITLCTFHVKNSILNQHTLQWGNTFAHNGCVKIFVNNLFFMCKQQQYLTIHNTFIVSQKLKEVQV